MPAIPEPVSRNCEEVSKQLIVSLAARPEDGVLMTMVELSLVLIYICVLLIKTCAMSSNVCVTFGFGDAPDGDAAHVHS